MSNQGPEVEALPWTGERYLPDVGGNIQLEHIHRYVFASRMAAGKRVLDIACGEGYGSSLMAKSALSVVGVDIAEEAVAHARGIYKAGNLRYEVGSCAAIPLADHCVDLVVSFETIEHHNQHEAMMREIKRVLVPGGLLIISSPDKYEYTEKPGGYTNPYHVKELYRSEFESLLGSHFNHHRISGQRVVYGSAIFDEGTSSKIVSFEINDQTLAPAPGIAHALYLIAIASDIDLPTIESGFLEQPVNESDDVTDAIRQIRELNAVVGQREHRIVELQDVIEKRNEKLLELHDGLSRHNAELIRFQNSLLERGEQLLEAQSLVGQRDRQLTQVEVTLSCRDGDVHNLQSAIEQRERQILELKAELSRRDETLYGLRETLVQGRERIARLERELVGLDGKLAELTDIRLQGEQQIIDLKGELTGRDEKLGALDLDLAHRARELVDAQEMIQGVIADRELQVGQLRHLVSEQESRLTELRGLLVERTAQVKNLEDENGRLISWRNAEVGELRRQLDQTFKSRSWHLTKPLRGFSRALMSAKSFEVRSYIVNELAARKIRASSLFDAEYYLAHNEDLRTAAVDPVRHYCRHGWRELRDPSASFSTTGYLLEHPDVRQAHINPLYHYLRFGHEEGRGSRSSNTALEDSRANDFARPSGPQSMIEKEINELFPDSMERSAVATSEKNVSALQVSILEVPMLDPDRTIAATSRLESEIEDIKRSKLFDEAFYLSMYTDVPTKDGDVIRHYCEHGWRQGKNPSNDFDSRFYLDTYTDIRDAGLNPFWHYVVAGAEESRAPLPDAGSRYEDDIWFGDVQSSIQLLAFYASPNWSAVREGRPMFKAHAQPLFPHERLGFYDPAAVQTLQAQAEIARRHGIRGFCFDLDKRIDQKTDGPLNAFLAHSQIAFSFCVQLTIGATGVDQALVASLARAVTDSRYLRLKESPVILVTLAFASLNASASVTELRDRLANHGIETPLLIGRHAAPSGEVSKSNDSDLFDAMIDLPATPVPGETGNFRPIPRNGTNVVPYSVVAENGVARTRAALRSALPLFHCVSLGRDNSAGNTEQSLVYSRFQISDYRRWLDAAFAAAITAHPSDRRFVFVNGWNDWNAGLFLEPDRQSGYSRLNETTRAILGMTQGLPMPKVSVIVPNYNHCTYLRRRLNSIYSQTYTNIEVILLDDCSSDESRTVLDQYALAHPEITTRLYNETNSGSAFRQWSKGIKAATGDLVWIAESDDYCDSNFLEVLVRCFDDEAVLLAYSKCVFVAGNETPLPDEFGIYVSDLKCAEKWKGSYVETSHNEVKNALGIKNTIPNASGVLFKRPIDLALLDDERWRSMAVAGDWVFYLHVIRGGKVAYASETRNFFRRYEGSTAEVTYKKAVFYREVGMASRAVAEQYDVPIEVLEQCRDSFLNFYRKMVGRSDDEFALWYDFDAVLQARQSRQPNVMVSTMGFFPGGAEILPIRLANEFKRQGLSVLLLSAGLTVQDNGIRRMLRNDVPLVVMPEIGPVKTIIEDFGVEVLNSHQWHIQRYPSQVPDVFSGLRGHVASLHGMIEHEDAFGVTQLQLQQADHGVSTWVYTADKNLGPFSKLGLYHKASARFVKIPNGMHAPRIVPISRADIGIPDGAFTLCCVSRAIPDKGWAETIDVVERARTISGRDIRLILVGNGAVYDAYCQTGVPDFVHLAGFSENAVGYYAASDMGIMLTKFKSESFPLTIVDCLFAGKPYIASDVGEIRNMLTTSDGVAGAVIELEQWEIPIEQTAAIVASFASDGQAWQRAQGLVQEIANRYRIDSVAAHYIRIFESSCGQGQSR